MADKKVNRRGFMKQTLLASAGTAAAMSLEEQALLAADKPAETPRETSAKGMPMGKIGKLQISRLICGGILIGGYAHSRDLVYVSSLMKHYNTEKKVLDTLELCEQNGINAFLSDPRERPLGMITKYWKQRRGKMLWIAEGHPKLNDIKTNLKRSIDNGASAIYVQGGVADGWVRGGHVDKIAQAVRFIKENGLVAGVGGHMLAVPQACEKAGIEADFYMKTLHSPNYWSRKHPRERDNVWSRTPAKTIEFMKNVTKPWIAYKVLAAGAISPTVGFKYAFTGGADFICVGMFDFQVKDDVQIAKGLFARGIKRQRPWQG